MRVCFLDLDGTLLGPGGCLLTDGAGAFTTDAVLAIGALRSGGVHVVLVSGRTRAQLTGTARLLGADGIVAELGACEVAWPGVDGASIAERIEATGVVDALIAEAGGTLVRFAQPGIVREASVLLRGRAPADAGGLVVERSGGRLRLADNGIVAADGTRAFHVAPAGTGKGPAVAAYLRRLGARPDHALAVGNSREDAEITSAGVPVALVGNVRDDDPDLAASAAWVTRATFGAGVLEAVRQWLG